MNKILAIKNTSPSVVSLTFALPIGPVSVSLTSDGAEYRAALTAKGETFIGRGKSPVLALQELATGITEAAVKQQPKGRTRNRVRVAATLLHCGPK
jgi:hypothetical protein